MNALVLLARSPRAGAAAVLAHGSLRVAFALVLVSTSLAVASAARFAEAAPVQSVLFGDERSAAVSALLAALGREQTAALLYLFERSYDALVVAIALTPPFIWILGSTAVQAAARLAGTRAAFTPMLVLFGYATALTRAPADVVALAAPRSAVAGLAGPAVTVWLGVIAWRAIRSHYGMAGGRALTTLVVGIVLFYLVPLVLIVLAAVAILVAALVLDFFPKGA